MKFYIIAGEASGDLHASNLMRELKKVDASAQFRCWGGDMMKEQGAELVKHYKELAFMGFTEVLMNLRTILKNIEFCKKDILNFKPDVLILVDYPGFNLRIAEFAKSRPCRDSSFGEKNGLKVFYYISPQIWAWKQSRVHHIKKYVDRMFAILPFEKEFYKQFDYDIDFVGHPLLDALEQRQKTKDSFQDFTRKNNLSDKPIVAILPGSRKQEIEKMLPVMAEISSDFPDYQFVCAGISMHDKNFYSELIGKNDPDAAIGAGIKILFGKTYDLLEQSTAALVTSGTATLETALFGIPEVVCYKGGAISFQIAKCIVKVDYISLVNLIMKKEVVKELIQNEFNKKNLKTELSKLLNDQVYRSKMIDDLSELKKQLGGFGASKKTAELMMKYLS
ncbi:MAG: lipid-A-disaccharide synthase [Bacteroidetes bacterium]|nr:lipid-A-disaccharide synthase [Bacteroidota bacterium]